MEYIKAKEIWYKSTIYKNLLAVNDMAPMFAPSTDDSLVSPGAFSHHFNQPIFFALLSEHGKHQDPKKHSSLMYNPIVDINQNACTTHLFIDNIQKCWQDTS